MEDRIIKPQEGFQEKFLTSDADIVIGGGSAGGGKTFALLLDVLHYEDVEGFGAVIFRRTTPQITSQGGLWDTSMELYPHIGASLKQSKTSWIFQGGQKLKFSHLEYEKDKLSWQGSQIAYIGFDELTQFTLEQFLYLMSRNRSTCDMKPCIRATCNPDPDSWVAEFISWWIDEESGFPIPERDGILRYFTRDGDNWVWGSTKQEVLEKCSHMFDKPEYKDINKEDLIKSATFIRGDIYGNKELMEKDPSYLANLNSLNEEEKAQLLDGNWKIRTDNLSLCQYAKITDMFSNFAKESSKRYITCDVAGAGKDLAVIFVWEGLKVIKIIILTTCDDEELKQALEEARKDYNVPKSHTIYDNDGMGWGLSSKHYVPFTANGPVLEDPDTGIKENYVNLKTQCAYRMAKRINNGEVQIDLDNVYVDGVKVNYVTIGKDKTPVRKLIEDDMRSFKKDKMDMDKKRQMIPKKKQKSILNGRSPDCGDTIIMREYFELHKEPEIYLSFA